MTLRPSASFWSSTALFLLPALSLVLPSGYSYGPALLMVVSLVSLPRWWGKVPLPREAWWLWGSLALLAVSWLVDDVVSGGGFSALERPLKVLLTLPCLYYLTWRPPQALWLWHGLVVGAAGAFVLALWQLFVDQQYRAAGFTNAIQFGDLALLFGMLALCGWNACAEQTTRWRTWLLLGFFSGTGASLLSGSRGGWLALVLLAGAGLVYLGISGQWRTVVTLILLGTVGLVILAQVPQLRLSSRIIEARKQFNAYTHDGDANASIGARFQMWGFAWNLYQQKPVLGWTQQGYMEEKRRSIDAHALDQRQAEYNHPHNEVLDAASKRGTLGLLVLLLAYATPTVLFLKRFRVNHDGRVRSLSLAGMTIPLGYIGFGLTQAFLVHNSGVMVYAYLLCLIWASLHGLPAIPPTKT